MKNKLQLTLIAVIVSISILFVKCDQDFGGLNVLPTEDIVEIGFDSTFQVNAYTVPDDSLVIYGMINAMLGSYVDPIFGKAKAEFALEFRMVNNFSYGEEYTLDSIRNGDSFVIDTIPDEYEIESIHLSLAYKRDSTYLYNIGNTAATQKIILHELILEGENPLQNRIPSNLSLLDDKERFISDEIVAEFEFTPYEGSWDKSDSILYFELPKSIADHFVEMSKRDIIDNYVMHEEFFRGFYFELASAEDASIIMFDLSSTDTNIELNYINKTKEDTSVYFFLVEDASERFNNFDHFDYEGAGFKVGETEEVLQQEYLYLQSTGGLKTTLRFPDLKDKLEGLGNMVISAAELTFTATTLDYEEDNTATSVFLLGIAEDNTEFLLDEYDSDSYLNIEFDPEDPEFKLNITNYVQEIVSGEKHKGLNLYNSSRKNTLDRLILKNDIELRISYLPIKD